MVPEPKNRLSYLAGLVLLFFFLAHNELYAGGTPFDHSGLTGILQATVDEQGGVDYQGIRDRGREKLEAYVKSLQEADLNDMSEKERMAFYINAYNAFTLQLIVDHYPLESIRKIPDLSGVVGFGQWKKELWTLEGERISLDTIEHKILRPMGDPRIHFALVCAARSCPNLARKAYTGGTLDDMLHEQGQRFNRSPKGLQTSMEKRFFRQRPVLRVSSIYKWFRGDFLRVSKDLPGFVLPYASAEDRAFIEANREHLKVDYLDYDWDLNEQR